MSRLPYWWPLFLCTVLVIVLTVVTAANTSPTP